MSSALSLSLLLLSFLFCVVTAEGDSCEKRLSTEAGEAVCMDGIDNDGNGYVDCNDFNCCPGPRDATPPSYCPYGCGYWNGHQGGPFHPNNCVDCDPNEITCSADEDCPGPQLCLNKGKCYSLCSIPPNPEHLVVMTLNIDATNDPDMDTWTDIVVRANPDLLVLVETEGLDLEAAVKFFEARGMNYEISTEPNAPRFGGTTLMSKFGVEKIEGPVGQQAWGAVRNYMFWTVLIDPEKETRVLLTGMHLKCCGGDSSDLKRNNDMEGLIQYIDATYSQVPYIILAGDYNSYNPADQLADPNFNKGTLNDRPLDMLLQVTGNAVNQSSEFFKYVDLYREDNPQLRDQDHTYLIPPYESRIDYLVATSSILQDMRLVNSYVTDMAADHCGIVATFVDPLR